MTPTVLKRFQLRNTRGQSFQQLHWTDAMYQYLLSQYMGHFKNNAQGGKTAEWMMQSQ